MNPLKQLLGQGQSVWLDYIHRNLIRTGELRRMIEEDGVRGVTSNPTIFEKAIAGSDDYDDLIREALARDPDAPVGRIYELIAVRDIQAAADVLRPIYDESGGADGYVSLEVSPHLAHETEATVAEAKRLKAAVDRPNLIVKVPATPAGIPAIEELIASGVNVNITLMFSLRHYETVAEAYIRGLERCPNPGSVASVASFFVSRVDTAVDKQLEALGTPEARSLLGKVAVANSKIVYRRFREIFHGEGFAPLRQRGARVQKPLWASTGTKNPAYSDVLYVQTLIGPETVSTMPVDTLNAFRDHGRADRATVMDGLEEATLTLERVRALGIDLDAITEKLQEDGVAAFAASFDQLMEALERKRRSIAGIEPGRQELNLGRYERRVARRLKEWQAAGFARRLWSKDPTLWSETPQPELVDRLGWLDLPESMVSEAEALEAFAARVAADGIRHIVLLGMGGSSLAPEVFQETFGAAPGFPELIVLDSTHPDAVRSVDARIDLERTLFVVSSKSGTTIETQSFFLYFWDRVQSVASAPGAYFVAITDPATPLERLARERNFRAVFNTPPDVGGRYSALTHFGLLPAALIGVDIRELLRRARKMREACAERVPEPDNPALVLGAALGELALSKRDKITFLTSPSLGSFPSWAEQLIAESTGKARKGIIPVVGEEPGPPAEYGDDRLFVYLRLEGDQNHHLDRQIAALQANEHPVVRLELTGKSDLGQEFLRWEIAVAAAGAVLGIHPFNQPDVQLAKDLARNAMNENATDVRRARIKEETQAGDPDALAAAAAWLDKMKPRDYVAVQAYLNPSPAHDEALRRLANALRERTGVAITVGYGPRFLHSTGQLHKGGPNSVLVLQLVDRPRADLGVPETDYSFGALIRAQAIGDLGALKQRRRRLLRVDLQDDAAAGLDRLVDAIRSSRRE